MKHLVLALAIGVFLLPLVARADTQLEVYGHADLSADYVNRGTNSVTSPSLGCQGTPGDCINAAPYGQISSNLSSLGVRVTQDLGNSGLKVLLQFETLVDVSATPSAKDSLGSRDSYIGLGGSFGAIKLGKSDTPYKKATSRMDPFSASVGDYNSIMGNSGGDNRAEFDLRLPHSVWWESPKMGGVNVSVMVTPGQNRTGDNSGVPEGEFYAPGIGLCAGSGVGGSGAAGPPCNDGSFGNAISTSVFGDTGTVYWTAAYELHKRVNREGDQTDPVLATKVGARDESAIKGAAQYHTPQMTVNFIVEDMMRKLGDEPTNLDERSRTGYYVSGVDKAGDGSQVELAWGHANKTKGDPAGVTPNNQANLYALGYRHFLASNFAIYGVYATQVNGNGAHYDLGASGHGIPIVGRDGSPACDNSDGCLPTQADGTIKGVTISALSIGFSYSFSAPFEVAAK